MGVSGRIPEYGNRKGWRPKETSDYGDGGSYPELHVAQFPLEMGRKLPDTSNSSIIPLSMDATGKIKYEAVLGKHDKKKVYSTALDLIEYEPDTNELQLPTEEEIIETAERTRDALSKKISGKIQSAIPAKLAEKQAAPVYFQYTPQGNESNKRVIKLVEMPKDPLEPPKFEHKKVVRPPGSPPVPVVHSPPRKLTAKDLKDWDIPPCISNWKNQRGLTIALDKRLAADGRGLQKPQINDKFATFAESLYLAERNARQMVEQREEINRLLAEKERKEKEKALSELASRGRANRMGPGENAADESRSERDRIREEERKRTEREMRLENLKKGKKREEDRDISEKIALGQKVTALSGEAQFDQRLFNQSQGMSTGFGADDSYNVFDRPLFQTSAQQLFRPKKNDKTYGSEADLEELKNVKRFQADQGFAGTEDEDAKDRKKFVPRSGPVQFEQSAHDEFEFLDEFIDEAKSAKMDAALSKTMMSAPRRKEVQAQSESGSSPTKGTHRLFPEGSRAAGGPSSDRDRRQEDSYSTRSGRDDYDDRRSSDRRRHDERDHRGYDDRRSSKYDDRDYDRHSRSSRDYGRGDHRDLKRGNYDRDREERDVKRQKRD